MLIRRLSLFILFFLLIAGGLVGISSAYMNNVKFSIAKGKNILVIGDSHTECSIDDSAFKRAANFSKSATSVVYSYAALRKLISDNPQIDTVLLSFHSSSLSKERDEGWIFDETMMGKQVPVFLPYFTADQIRLFLFTPQFYKQALKSIWSTGEYMQAAKNGKQQDWIHENIGHFRDLNWSNFSKDTASTKPWTVLQKQDTASPLALRYFKKINDLCKEHHITLVLVNAPVYQWEKYADYRYFEETRRKYLSDLQFVDYARFPIADSCRFDIWHLNGTGARKFSAYLESSFASDLAKQHAATPHHP